MLPAVRLQLLQMLRGHLPPHHLLEISRVLAVYGGLAGQEQRVLILVVAGNPQEAVLLHVGRHRELQLMLQHVEPGLGPLVHIEELVVGPGHHLSLHSVQVQAPGLGGLSVPDSFVEGLVRVVEGGDAAVLLLLDILILAQGHDDICNVALRHCLLLQNLRRPVHLIGHLDTADALPVHLDAAQAAAVFHLPLQVEHPVVDLHGQLLGVAVPVDLVAVLWRGVEEGLGYDLEVIVAARP